MLTHIDNKVNKEGIFVNLSAKSITRVALFTSLISMASLILKLGGDVVVPFSILPLMVMLAGSILGPRLGALSVLVYVVLGLIGVPVFAKPPFGGLTYVFQPTFGFLLGFIIAAYVIGMVLEKIPGDSIFKYLGAMLCGIFVIYIIGIPYLYAIIKIFMGKPFTFWKAIQVGLLPFIGLDLAKGVLAGFVAKNVINRLSYQGMPRVE